jgi:1-acyl-sn-glycerol-3-phosphate acyltransferase
MIVTEEFRAQLIESHAYCTPEDVDRSLWHRMFGRLDIVYKAAIMGIVIRGGRMARRGEWNRDSWLNLSLDVWRAVENCGGRLNVSGCENLQKLDGPAVIVSNHMSVLETFAIPAIVLPFQHMTFVVKESLLRVPLFKDVMMGVNPISLGRENPREDLKRLLADGEKMLADGKSIVIFPQSTRCVELRPGEFNSIGSKLAKKAGVPLVPLALKTDFHGLGKVVKDFGPVDRGKTVYFKFGAPLEISGNGRQQHEACIDFIAENLKSWGGSVQVDAAANA